MAMAAEYTYFRLDFQVRANRRPGATRAADVCSGFKSGRWCPWRVSMTGAGGKSAIQDSAETDITPADFLYWS